MKKIYGCYLFNTNTVIALWSSFLCDWSISVMFSKKFNLFLITVAVLNLCNREKWQRGQTSNVKPSRQFYTDIICSSSWKQFASVPVFLRFCISPPLEPYRNFLKFLLEMHRKKMLSFSSEHACNFFALGNYLTDLAQWEKWEAKMDLLKI